MNDDTANDGRMVSLPANTQAQRLARMDVAEALQNSTDVALLEAAAGVEAENVGMAAQIAVELGRRGKWGCIPRRSATPGLAAWLRLLAQADDDSVDGLLAINPREGAVDETTAWIVQTARAEQALRQSEKGKF